MAKYSVVYLALIDFSSAFWSSLYSGCMQWTKTNSVVKYSVLECVCLALKWTALPVSISWVKNQLSAKCGHEKILKNLLLRNSIYAFAYCKSWTAKSFLKEFSPRSSCFGQIRIFSSTTLNPSLEWCLLVYLKTFWHGVKIKKKWNFEKKTGTIEDLAYLLS